MPQNRQDYRANACIWRSKAARMRSRAARVVSTSAAVGSRASSVSKSVQWAWASRPSTNARVATDGHRLNRKAQQVRGTLHAAWLERFHGKPQAFQPLGRHLHCRANFRHYRNLVKLLPDAHPHSLQLRLAQYCGLGKGIQCVITGQHAEQQSQVACRPRHGAGDSGDPGGVSQGREVASAGMRPGVGFNPAMPQKCAGTRMEPPPSEARPPGEQKDAIAAASPPLDPPGVRAPSQGLLVRPVRKLSVS